MKRKKNLNIDQWIENRKPIVKINEIKAGSLKASLTWISVWPDQEKRERTEMKNMRNKREDITTDSMNFKR